MRETITGNNCPDYRFHFAQIRLCLETKERRCVAANLPVIGASRRRRKKIHFDASAQANPTFRATDFIRFCCPNQLGNSRIKEKNQWPLFKPTHANVVYHLARLETNQLPSGSHKTEMEHLRELLPAICVLKLWQLFTPKDKLDIQGVRCWSSIKYRVINVCSTSFFCQTKCCDAKPN